MLSSSLNMLEIGWHNTIWYVQLFYTGLVSQAWRIATSFEELVFLLSLWFTPCQNYETIELLSTALHCSVVHVHPSCSAIVSFHHVKGVTQWVHYHWSTVVWENHKSVKQSMLSLQQSMPSNMKITGIQEATNRQNLKSIRYSRQTHQQWHHNCQKILTSCKREEGRDVKETVATVFQNRESSQIYLVNMNTARSLWCSYRNL